MVKVLKLLQKKGPQLYRHDPRAMPKRAKTSTKTSQIMLRSKRKKAAKEVKKRESGKDGKMD